MVNLSDGCDTSLSFLLGQVHDPHIPQQLHLLMNERTTHILIYPASIIIIILALFSQNVGLTHKDITAYGLCLDDTIIPCFRPSTLRSLPLSGSRAAHFSCPTPVVGRNEMQVEHRPRSTTTMGIQDIWSIAVNRTRRLRKTHGRLEAQYLPALLSAV